MFFTAKQDRLTSFQDVQKSLEEFADRSIVVELHVSPYLQSQFEMLCQYNACAEGAVFFESHPELGMLAGRSTATIMRLERSANAWETLAQIQDSTAIGISNMELATIRNILPISMLHKLEAMTEVPLRCLGLLVTEIGSIAKNVAGSSAAISSEPLQYFRRLLLMLRDKLHVVLNSEASFPDLKITKEALDQLLSRNRETTDQRRVHEVSQHLQHCLESIYEQNDIPMTLSEPHGGTARMSAVLIQSFTGCLLLYVPDRPFDPALMPTVERNRHIRRRSELETKLRALQDFEVVFSGQKSSLRSQLVERRLAELGVEPEVPMIFRPQTSELGQLQAEFNNVVNNVVLRSPTPSMLQSVLRGEASKIQEVKFLRTNIAQTLSRLSQGFQAYEDITKPLIGFLQGLDVGLALSILIGGQSNSRDLSVRYMCEMIPFLGADPQKFARTTVSELDLYRLQTFDPRLYFLKFSGIARSVNIAVDPLVQKSFQVFHSFYREWKENLGHDQQRNAARSSLYRYRGGEEESNEADEQDFHSLFPDHTRPNEQATVSQELNYDARCQAQRLATLQYEVFQSTKTTSEGILDLLHDASQIIAGLWKSAADIPISPVPAENLLSALVLSLDKHKEQLLGQARVEKLYNFYSDANLFEAQKVISLVHNIQARFLVLREAWPEHATLADVLRTSLELLALRHTEPLSKILTKAEQLHSYIHEWQVVASKQYTAAKLYDQLTDLLVSWRRLELSTWARLLDMEDQKCTEDTKSWWFVAYEVIIAAPLSMVDAGEDLQVHVEKLCVTLADFMRTTCIGQYAHRLSMIDCFRSHLEVLAKDVPSIGVVHRAIFNFLRYHAHFESSTKDHLRKGRQKLEKEMKEILLLASWKDTNINALRDSAKRSHHKLFKVIRKYRSLLAQSAETFVAQEFPSEPGVSAPSNRADDVPKVTRVDPRAIETCKNHLESWVLKSERFTNPTMTAMRMVRMSQLPPTAIDGASLLDSFRIDLRDSIKDLQKETAPKATKENVEVMKHLKARKRKLYADCLKTLRHLGFSSNMSADALAKQSSLSVTLANTPALVTQSHDLMASAEFHFHRVLHIIPEIKERSRNHSPDLSHGEVSRSIGFIESMLSVILRQRSVLATALSDLQELEKAVVEMRNLWAPDSYALRKQEIGQQNTAKGVRNVLRWLPGIVEAGSVIVEKHGTMGELDHSRILAALVLWKEKLAVANDAFDHLPELSPGLSSSRHERTCHDAVRLLEDFKTNLQQLIEYNPGLSFVLKQIAQWTGADVASDDLLNEGSPTSLVDLDNSVSNVSNSILVAMQRMQEVSVAPPSSDEDASWLIRADFSLAAILKALRPREVKDMLREAMLQIQFLSTANDDHLSAAGARFALSLPIVQQFSSVLQISFDRYAELHQACCKLADDLARSFSQFVRDGFCSPAEDSAAEAGRTKKLEGGTGLGEGEGAEDISNDIQNDEDLTELAQSTDKTKENEDIEDQEDAVNMDDDELEGETRDISDKGEDDGSPSEGEEKDFDEEVGSVNDLDPSAVDEKFWDGNSEETDKKKDGAKAKGKIETNEQIADDASEQAESTQMQKEEEQADEASQNGLEETEEITKEERETLDPHVQEGQKTDLPEEMDLDNIDVTDNESASGDSDMDGMSDVEKKEAEEEGAHDFSERSQDDQSEENVDFEADTHSQPEMDAKDGEDVDVDRIQDAGSPEDTEPDGEEPANDPELLLKDIDNQSEDQKNSAPSDAIGLGKAADPNETEERVKENRAQGKDSAQGNATSTDEPEAAAEKGQLGKLNETEGGRAQDETRNESPSSQAFKKLGDALEKWHRQNRHIQEAPENRANAPPPTDVEMADRDFEHLQDEATEADRQALGAASDDQARALDRKAMDSEMNDEPYAFHPDSTDEENAKDHDEMMNEDEPTRSQSDKQQEKNNWGAFVASRTDWSQQSDPAGTVTLEKEEVDDLDNSLSITHLQPASETSPCSAEEARRLWSHYENLTRDLSHSLTEQLRLILAPTVATKMRGDFRTGKRLNIKRIIPYIASQYKRDKIWMRRSIPSKRNYHIMLAVDDSKSMGESGSGQLAFETLALVSKSLSILEVGEICVVGFGNEVHVAHEFDRPFSSEAGAQIFQNFSFQQTKTNVRKLVANSITLFREARRRTFNHGTELWQLELIISDGVCEDHDTIRRLVRQAQEEHIMIVFVIVDALLKGESIMDMTQAVFELDGGGETKLKIKRYLDDFPFAYYLVVGDMRELSGALAQALRQWFAEVVESG